MKKVMAVLFVALMVIPFAFASIKSGDRISVYDNEETQDAVVGNKGYIDVSVWNTNTDVFVCASKDKVHVSYGMNLRNNAQISTATELVKELLEKSFEGFNHYGCLRARV